MPLPFLIGGVAIALGAAGLAKGAKGISDITDANDIASRADRNLSKERDSLNELREEANLELQNLGQLKVEIFTHQIKHIVDVLNKTKRATSKLTDFNQALTTEDIKEMQQGVNNSLQLQTGLLTGASAGALAGLGAYGSVGLFASASTGTAISTLSGIAAQNATLAWLGGGSLAAGGFGIAGGTLVLGGIVTAPALAIAGFHMAGKGEEALTKAHEYAARAESNIAKIKIMKSSLNGLMLNSVELQLVLLNVVKRFEQIKVNDDSDEKAFEKMIAMGLSLKKLLEQPVMTPDGEAIKNLRHTCEGYIELN